ncbi:MAG: leucine-rich repeat domain-containing protein [Bacteroidales bacterium]|nr:leucine-rich repeat domain-containing protein [Bacteroidales bacterium]MCM1416519.1 leucine-rich repeat domain-containing protein [bacterium]MCM1424497.1 leucine-rich repeat domain-containing protein [bacterium]
MKQGEWSTAQGCLMYRTDGETAEITGCRGRDPVIEVPAQIEGKPVTRIGKKAFLSNKAVREIALPDGILQIGDWAFACCAKLTKIVLPYRRLESGQGIFRDCVSLAQIVNGSTDAQDKNMTDVSYLMAAAVCAMDAFYLFDPESAGSAAWFAGWDARLRTVMETPDAEGFSKMLLCGEEDYGSRENNLDHYTGQQRRRKVRLAMCRLLHDSFLAAADREALTAYLLAHRKGQETEETWRVVLEEHGDELACYRFLTEIGAVDRENFQAVLADLGEAHTEMKAYLMEYCDRLRAEADPFAAFIL